MENRNMLEIIFEAREEELGTISQIDKEFMKQDRANRCKKYEQLNQELNKLPSELRELKESISKLIEDYIETIDFIDAYFYKKYYLEGLKDGISLKEELR